MSDFNHLTRSVNIYPVTETELALIEAHSRGLFGGDAIRRIVRRIRDESRDQTVVNTSSKPSGVVRFPRS